MLLISKQKLTEKKELLLEVFLEFEKEYHSTFAKFKKISNEILEDGIVINLKQINKWYELGASLDDTNFTVHKMASMMESIKVIINSYNTTEEEVLLANRQSLTCELLDAMDNLVVELNRFKANRIEKFLELKEVLYALQKNPSDNALKELLISRKNYSDANVKYAKIFGYYNGITYSLGLIDDIQSI